MKLHLFLLFLTAGLTGLFAIGCGDETDGGDTSTDSETENGNSDNGESDTATDGTDEAGTDGNGTDGDEVDAVTACTDFLTTSWDRIRECGSDLVSILPENDSAAGLCTLFCAQKDASVSSEDLGACTGLAENLPCDQIPSDVASILADIPEECTFLTDDLGCTFPTV